MEINFDRSYGPLSGTHYLADLDLTDPDICEQVADAIQKNQFAINY